MQSLIPEIVNIISSYAYFGTVCDLIRRPDLKKSAVINNKTPVNLYCCNIELCSYFEIFRSDEITKLPNNATKIFSKIPRFVIKHYLPKRIRSLDITGDVDVKYIMHLHQLKIRGSISGDLTVLNLASFDFTGKELDLTHLIARDNISLTLYNSEFEEVYHKLYLKSNNISLTYIVCNDLIIAAENASVFRAEDSKLTVNVDFPTVYIYTAEIIGYIKADLVQTLNAVIIGDINARLLDIEGTTIDGNVECRNIRGESDNQICGDIVCKYIHCYDLNVGDIRATEIECYYLEAKDITCDNITIEKSLTANNIVCKKFTYNMPNENINCATVVATEAYIITNKAYINLYNLDCAKIKIDTENDIIVVLHKSVRELDIPANVKCAVENADDLIITEI